MIDSYSGRLGVASAGVLGAAAWLVSLASAQEPDAAAAVVSALPPASDLSAAADLVRVLGSPGVVLLLAWALRSWRPQITITVRHEIPNGSTLQVLTRAADPPEPDEDTTGWVRKRPKPDGSDGDAGGP
jgi:hypothetical protein